MTSHGGKTEPVDDVRRGRQVLPTNVAPKHYDLTLEPDFGSFVYHGKVSIDIDVREDTGTVALNARDLEIHETAFEVDGARSNSTPTLEYDEDSHTTTISLHETVPAGKALRIIQRFTGTLNDAMAGFYRSSYKDENGNDKYIATTQMEATDARRAFPCFDEPALKATFTITLVADHDMVCLSNMDVASQRDVESSIAGKVRKAVTYNTTPIMSTYLVAAVVGHLKVYENSSFRVPIRVYCTPDQNIEHAAFSAEVAARTLEFYEQKFGSEYPLPKLDMIAVPDFSAGAMENWGLITYRVVYLLIDEKNASTAAKRQVADSVHHELAHQWFGNLATMEFWDGLWLKEGFATWMALYAGNAFFPEFRIWDEYVISELRDALALDSLRSSHPIEVPVKRADEVDQIFDAISYQKGSCVIHMLSQYLGEELFLKGVRSYLERHAYGNTETSDLWAALSEASGQDVERVAGIWTRKIGYPVITVTEDAAKGIIRVEQNRFLRTGDVTPEEDEVLYPVFLNLLSKNGVDTSLTLDCRSGEYSISDIDFYKINSGHSGIYRVNYPVDRLKKLGQQARDGLLDVKDRTGMIADAGALAMAGYQQTSGLLSLLTGFNSETDFIAWTEISLQIRALKAAWVFEDDVVVQALESLQRHICSLKAREIGWTITDEDEYTQRELKTVLFEMASTAGDPTAKEAAFSMFNKFVEGDRDAIHPNLRSAVFASVLKYGGENEFNAVVKIYEESKESNDRNTALRALGSTRDPTLIQRTLDYALSKEVRSQDIYMPVSNLRSHKEGVIMLWKWLQTEWGRIAARVPEGSSLMATMVAFATGGFTKKEQREDVEQFFDKRGRKGFEQDLAQSLDAVRAKEKWVGRDAEDVKIWLKDNKFL